MARLSMAERRALPLSKFAVPSKAPYAGSYPMPDEAHERSAVGLAAMHHGPERAVRKKASALGLGGIREKS